MTTQATAKMSTSSDQNQNTAKLVMNTFYKLSNKNGVSANDIVNYLHYKYGDVWKIRSLVDKAEETLKRSSALGFLDKYGKHYLTNLVREARCRRRRRRKRCGRRRRRKRCCCRRRRRRRSC